jgi:hypothetical protein
MLPATRQPTSEEKQRFLEYIQKKSLQLRQNPIPKANASISNNTADLFAWLITDIVNKLNSFPNLSKENKQIINSPQFKDQLFKFIVMEGIDFVMNLEKPPFDPTFPILLQAQETPEDLLAVVLLQAMANMNFANYLAKGFVTAYMAKCLEFKIEIDAYMASLTN